MAPLVSAVLQWPFSDAKALPISTAPAVEPARMDEAVLSCYG